MPWTDDDYWFDEGEYSSSVGDDNYWFGDDAWINDGWVDDTGSLWSTDDYATQAEYDDDWSFDDEGWDEASSDPTGGLSVWDNFGGFLGNLFGGKDGKVTGKDMVGYGKGLLGAYMSKRDSDKYNQMMQPLADLYKAQAADVASRRANRDANIQAEYDAWLTGQNPYWDRRDQKAENLRHKQGKLQSSSAAWDRAATEQFRDATRAKQRLNIANAYDTRTGLLGGQLYGMNPAKDPNYIAKQENPYLQFAANSIFNV